MGFTPKKPPGFLCITWVSEPCTLACQCTRCITVTLNSFFTRGWAACISEIRDSSSLYLYSVEICMGTGWREYHRIRVQSGYMGTTVARVPQGWNVLLWEICGSVMYGKRAFIQPLVLKFLTVQEKHAWNQLHDTLTSFIHELSNTTSVTEYCYLVCVL